MYRWSLLVCSLFLYGCTTQPPSAGNRSEQAEALASAAGWKAGTVHTRDFVFKTYAPSPEPSSKTLSIYLEGDGFAWKTSEMASDNPTPIMPMGLELAIHDNSHTQVAYLARPCQFVFGKDWGSCRVDDWTGKRYSPKIIDATNQAVDLLKKRTAAQKIILIGYSGGGAIAALVAAQRSDVLRLITIAGMLDTQYWVNQQSLTPLFGSLNPADSWKSLASIPQTHWVGGKDRVVPKKVAFAYAARFPLCKQPEIRIIPSFDHNCCWATQKFRLMTYSVYHAKNSHYRKKETIHESSLRQSGD